MNGDLVNKIEDIIDQWDMSLGGCCEFVSDSSLQVLKDRIRKAFKESENGQIVPRAFGVKEVIDSDGGVYEVNSRPSSTTGSSS